MAIPVRFYSVTADEYRRIQEEMREACHVQEQQEEAERKAKEFESSIFFVEGDTNKEVNGNGST